MRATHRLSLYREGEVSDGGTDRRGTVEAFGQPELTGVKGRLAVSTSSGVEDAPIGQRADVTGTVHIPQEELDGYRIRPGDGVRIEQGDWTEPEYWHVTAVPQPGTGHWDVVVQVEANDEGFG